MMRLFSRNTGHGVNVKLVSIDNRIPWDNDVQLHNFQRKECYRFVPMPQQADGILIKDVRCFCGEVLSMHDEFGGGDVQFDAVIQRLVAEDFQSEFAQNNWSNAAPKTFKDYKHVWIEPFKSMPTNSCGKVHFSSMGDAKPAKFIRVSDSDEATSVWEFMKTAWRIMTPKPDLVVSVVGGAKNFRMEALWRDKFENGLLKIAETTQPLFITSGFNLGIMKAVGHIMKQGQSYSIRDRRAIHNIRCLGIAPWGFVKNRHSLEKRSFDVRYPMCKWKTGNFEPVPLNPQHTHFVLVDNGYRNRFTQCGNIAEYRAKLEERINRESPVVVVVVEGGSGVLSDILCTLSKKVPVVICSGTGRAADLMAYAFSRSDERGVLSDDYKAKVKEKLLKLYGKTWTDPDEVRRQVDILLTTVCDCLQFKTLVTIFDIQEDQGLDFYVLSALLKRTETCQAGGQLKKEDRLDLAISLNRADLAEHGLFGENDSWDVGILHSRLERCIVKDLDGFVRLLIQQENFEITKFLTKKRLEDIYAFSLNSDKVLYRLYVHRLSYGTQERITLSHVGRVIRRLLHCYDSDAYDKYNDQAEPIKDPFLQLFIWAVLNERKLLANLFWEYTDAPITTALLGSWLFLRMSKELPAADQEWIDNLLEGKRHMEEMAVQTLSDLHVRYPEQAHHCVEKDTPLWSNFTCLQIAAAADAKKFLASTPCQESLKSEWLGSVKMPMWKVILVLPLAICLPFFIGTWGKFRKPIRTMGWKPKAAAFFFSPRVKFTNYVLTYVAFLLLFTYLILFDLGDKISVVEGCCSLWALSIVLDELHRLACLPAVSKRSLFRLWRGGLYMVYLVSVLMVIIGLAVHYFGGKTKVVRSIYAVNCAFFYMRILRFYTASEHLGPKLHIIKSTLRPLFFFSLITLVFLLAYGVPSQALMYGKREPYWGVLYDIVYVPYWQIYGELQLEDFDTDQECIDAQTANNNTDGLASCRQYSKMVPLFLAIYLFFANVLLLNLIIAIFTKIFETVESNSVRIWKYQMYFFTKEYKVKSVLPTPFSIGEDLVRLLKHMTQCCCGSSDDHEAGLEAEDEKHLRWVERQVTDRWIRKMKEVETLSNNSYLFSIQKSINSLRSTLITDLSVLGRMAGGGVRGTTASLPATPKMARAGDRWSKLLHDHYSLTRAKQLLSTEYTPAGNLKSALNNPEDKDTVDGLEVYAPVPYAHSDTESESV